MEYVVEIFDDHIAIEAWANGKRNRRSIVRFDPSEDDVKIEQSENYLEVYCGYKSLFVTTSPYSVIFHPEPSLTLIE